MRPAVNAVIQRICSGTSVPRPRTCRINVPCATVSLQTMAVSIVGAPDGSSCHPKTAIASVPMPVALPSQLLLPFFGAGIANDVQAWLLRVLPTCQHDRRRLPPSRLFVSLGKGSCQEAVRRAYPNVWQ